MAIIGGIPHFQTYPGFLTRFLNPLIFLQSLGPPWNLGTLEPVRSQEARDHRAAKYQGGTCGMGRAAQWPNFWKSMGFLWSDMKWLDFLYDNLSLLDI